ncbi:MMPL family transporter [Candidatus Woesearchaeota archaeon]|nr:MMPL family transporter [Candidatus Woesearchaeota archaeon]
MSKLRKIFANTKVIILLVCLLLAAVAIHPDPFNNGVAIKAIAKNSSAESAGMEGPKSKITPMSLEVITRVNNKDITSVAEYFTAVSNLRPNQTVQIKTSKKSYSLVARPLINVTELNETETIPINKTIEINESVNGTFVFVNKTVEINVTRNKTLSQIVGVAQLGISVADAPTSNLRKGLDLQGGTRIIMRLEGNVSDDLVQDTIDALQQRLNVYGLSDIVIAPVTGGLSILDEPEKFILIEIAGATEAEIEPLIKTTGKFEAKIANQTVFRGGQDITYVCRTAQCSGIDPQRPCQSSAQGWSCGFSFAVTVNPSAAERFGELTKNIPVQGESLAEPLVLYLDDREVQSLSIAAGLRGKAATDVSISGGEQGNSETAARENTLQEMRKLQTILKTGSLPVKLTLERIDTISPSLGSEFLRNSIIMALVSLVAVAALLMIVYRRVIIAIPIIFTAVSEIFLTIGLAALIGWNIDLAAIAGIILAVGTGVNDQVIITDEALKKETEGTSSWKDRLKRAFFVITSSYLVTSASLLPLLFAGAGLLKGFAITSILAVTVGILVTRPAYAAIVHLLVEE